jgi:hypothetical protein
VVGDLNENRGGTARTEGRAKSCSPDRFKQPEFLPGAGDWKTLRYGLRVQRLVRLKYNCLLYSRNQWENQGYKRKSKKCQNTECVNAPETVISFRCDHDIDSKNGSDGCYDHIVLNNEDGYCW